MNTAEIASGQLKKWTLVNKLGEGDAGEVHLVESLLEKSPAILKRPHRSAFTSDVMRQAAQIESEGKILRALAHFTVHGLDYRLSLPDMVDQSQPGTEFSERFFIVITRASGFDLNYLSRVVRFRQVDQQEAPDQTAPGGWNAGSLANDERLLLEAIARSGQVPELLLLRALDGMINLFERLHSNRINQDGLEAAGVLWNDVKPGHLFWDARRASFTIIDWGNSQFLEEDGATRDRRFSRNEDYSQFLQEMGRYLVENAPDLHARLAWPASVLPGLAYTEGVKKLKDRLSTQLQEQTGQLRAFRQAEADLLQTTTPDLDHLQRLEELQTHIMRFGELPDYYGLRQFSMRLAGALLADDRLQDFKAFCKQAASIPAAAPEKWVLLLRALELIDAQPQADLSHDETLEALQAGASDDWGAFIWRLLAATEHARVSDGAQPWWDEVIQSARRMQMGVEPDTQTPLVVANRVLLTVQAACQKLADMNGGAASRGGADIDPASMGGSLTSQIEACSHLASQLREEVIKKWRQTEPDPPFAGVDYAEVDHVAESLAVLLPGANQALQAALEQPRAQARIVIDAWARRDFDAARLGLRGILLWDPDRRRLLTADRMILSAPYWLDQLSLGPHPGQDISDFVTQLELDGREIRNLVGPAPWLDNALEALMRLRRGAYPSDLLIERPELANDLPWLNHFRSRPSATTRPRPVNLERTPSAHPEPILRGIRQVRFGADQEVLLAEPLDTWAPEARGSSARVFLGFLRSESGHLRQAAVKIMRGDRPDYALPLFMEETRILTLMRDVPGISPLLESGYIRPDAPLKLPSDDRHTDLRSLRGEIQRFGVNETRKFFVSLQARVQEGWLPYLALERRSPEENLMALCDAGHTGGRFLPVEEALRMAIQICEILEIAHKRNIVYRDHKILHYYWLEDYNGIFVIDWNVARFHPKGLADEETQFDLVQFGARALHHILTGRTAPGALPLGPTRPEEIEQASHTYNVQWTYDDQRLPYELRLVIERTLVGDYTQAAELKADLIACLAGLYGGPE